MRSILNNCKFIYLKLLTDAKIANKKQINDYFSICSLMHHLNNSSISLMKLIPLCAHISGTKESLVIPGCVLISNR
jgi:hypothetical protein